MGRFESLKKHDGAGAIRFIDPPFQFNAPSVSTYPAEVSGWHLLRSLQSRLGWTSFADRKLLDFGCGVRFARTIYNLGIPFGLYAGVDIHRAAIEWLAANITEPGFRFAHLNARNAYYNPEGSDLLGPDALVEMGLPMCDAACMFSVITHQSPSEASVTFAQLRRVVSDGGQMYFTAFLDEGASEYLEQRPNEPGHMSTYHPDALIRLVESSGWQVTAIYDASGFQLSALVCEAV